MLVCVNVLFRGARFFGIKRQLLRLAGARIAHNVRVMGPIYFNPITHLDIGEGTWVGRDFRIEGNGDVTIGTRCDIAPSVFLSTGSHGIGKEERRAGCGYNAPILIGDGCWIGVRVTILSGVTVAKGCVLAAGAVVTKSGEANGLYGGVPAQRLRELEVENT